MKRLKLTIKLSKLILNINRLFITKEMRFINLIDMKKRLKLSNQLSKLILNLNRLFIAKEMLLINLIDMKKHTIYITKLLNCNLIMHCFIALEVRILWLYKRMI